MLESREHRHSVCQVASLCEHWELHNTSVCHHVCCHICDFSMDVKLEQRANSANPEQRLLKCYDVRMEMRPCIVRCVSSGTRASREAEHHLKTTRGQGNLPWSQPLKMWKQFGGLCMRIVGEQLRRLPSSTAVFFAVWGRTFSEKDLNCGAWAIGCSMMTTHPLTELSQHVSFSPTTLPHFRICLTLQIWPLATSSCSRRWSCCYRVADLTGWRTSSGNCRMCLVSFENRTSSMCSSSGNGAGIGVSLHKETILKGMLPKLKSGTYIVVYGSSRETFWYNLVDQQKTICFGQQRPSSGLSNWAIRVVYI